MRRCYHILGLGFALIGVVFGSSECRAQFGNRSNFPMLTYLGRYHGIGYSQGYHACGSGNCSPVSQLHRAASVPVAFAPPLAPPAVPLVRAPWPDLGGNNWSQYQSMELPTSNGYSLYATPDLGNTSTAPPASPSDANPRLRPPTSAEPLPAPSQPQPASPTTSQRQSPTPTRFPFQ